MTKALSDTRFLTQIIKDAWRPTLCPRCRGLWVRDFRAPQLTYQCQKCTTRWVCAVAPTL